MKIILVLLTLSCTQSYNFTSCDNVDLEKLVMIRVSDILKIENSFRVSNHSKIKNINFFEFKKLYEMAKGENFTQADVSKHMETCFKAAITNRKYNLFYTDIYQIKSKRYLFISVSEFMNNNLDKFNYQQGSNHYILFSLSEDLKLIEYKKYGIIAD